MTKHRNLFLPFKYHLLTSMTIALATGILWKSLDYSLIGPFTLIALVAAIHFTTPHKNKYLVKTIFLLFSIFLAGAFLYTQKINSQASFYKEVDNKTCDLIATVKDVARWPGKRHKQTILLDLKKVKEKNTMTWKSYPRKSIRLYIKNAVPLQVADTIKLKNITFKRPKNPSYSLYLIKENTSISLFTDTLQYETIQRPSYSLSRLISQKRAHLAKNIKERMAPKTFELFSSIFLGAKKIEKKHAQQLKHRFKYWGVLHFLARSGLHLILFLLLCEIVLKLLPIHFAIKQGILITISTLYLLLSWPSVSFIRAFAAFVLYKLCPLLNIKPDLFHIVTLICFSMLLYNPIQLFFIDFQLSFALTAALALCNKIQTQKKRQAQLVFKKSTQTP